MKAVVTGHTRGLGAAIATALLSHGIPVLGLARSKNPYLQADFPGAFEQHALDLADTAALSEWLTSDTMTCFLAGSKTTLLVNNAATVHPIGTLSSQDAQTIPAAVALNVNAPLMLTAAVAAIAREDDSREVRVLHISSGAARIAASGLGIYCATKAALDHHARTVASEQSPVIRICSLAPGIIDTEMQASLRKASSVHFTLREMFDAYKRNGLLSHPDRTARQVVEFLLDERFGDNPVTEI